MKNYKARPLFEHRWKVYYLSPKEYTYSPDLTNDVKYCLSRVEVQQYLDMVNEIMYKVNGHKNSKYVLEENEDE